MEVSGGHKFTQVSAGESSSAAINEKGRTYIWGSYYTYTYDGSEGDYEIATVEYPVDTYGRPHAARICVEGIASFLALDFDGRAWGWGSDYPGKIYYNYLIDYADPVEVSGGHKFTQVSAGTNHALGLDFDGRAWAWGKNSDGQLGDGTRENRTAPVEVSGGHKFTQIVAGGESAFGLDASGIWWAWGANNFGQLGDGSKENCLTPVPVGLGKIQTKMNPEQFKLERLAGFSQVVFNKQDLLVSGSGIIQAEKTFKDSEAPFNLAAGDKAVFGVVKGVDATGDKLVGSKHSFEAYVACTHGISVSVRGSSKDSVNVDALKVTVSVDIYGYRNL